MKKIFKIFITLIVALALFLISAMYLFTKMVEPTVFKEQLARAIYLKTGRQPTINGEVKLLLFPDFGVVVKNLELSNSSYFPREKFAHADSVTIRVKLFPLFAHKVVISKFIFKNVVINLVRDDSGINNWDDVTESMKQDISKKEEATERDEEVVEAVSVTGDALPLIYLSNIDIENAVIKFSDQLYQKYLSFKVDHASAEGINLHGNPFTFVANGAFRVNSPEVPGINRPDEEAISAKGKGYAGDFALSGSLVFDWLSKTYAVDGLKITGHLLGQFIKEKTDFQISADVDSDLGKQELSVKNLNLQLSNLLATGQLRVSNIIYAPEVVGDLSIAAFDPKPLLHACGVIKDIKAAESVWQSVALKFTLQTTSRFLKIPDLEMMLNGSKISGSASYSHFNDKFVVFSLDVDRLDWGRYQNIFALITPASVEEPAAVPAVSAVKASVVAASSSLSGANNIKNTARSQAKNVDDSAANFADKTKKATKKRGKNSKKSLSATTVDVAAMQDVQDADQWDLHSKKAIKHQAPLKHNAGASGELYAMLNAVSISGDMHIGDLQLANNVHLGNVKLEVNGDNGKIEITPFSCGFYKGLIDGAINVDVRDNTPSFVFSGKITNFAVQTFLKDFIGSDKLSGIGVMRAKLQTKGAKVAELLKNLSGTASLSITNGTLYGIDVAQQVEKVKAFVSDAQTATVIAKEVGLPRTSFSQLRGNFKLAHGIASTADLVLQALKFKVKGRGDIDLAAHNLNLQLDAAYAERAEFFIPIKVTGSFTAPSIKPDVAVFMGRLLKDAVVDKLSDQLNKGLKNGKIDADKLVKSLNEIDSDKLSRLLGK